MKVKEESEKVGLKFNIQTTKIMASSPITSQQIDGETMETVTDFILWGSKITTDGDCSHEIKRYLLLGRKAMTKLDRIGFCWQRSRSSQSYGFSCSPRDSQESSPRPQFKSVHSLALSFLYSPLSHPCMTAGKTTAFTRLCWQSNVSVF